MVVHVIRRYERVPEEIVRRYEGIGIAAVHESNHKLGAMCAQIKPIYPGMRLCGTALTVKAQPGDNMMLHKALDICRPGEVIVVSIDGYEGGPWGEQMSAGALGSGCAGLVIDGYARDGLGIKALGFPVFARGLSIKGTFKEAIGFINHPISCGGVVVRPGDLVVGDDDGVCVVERERAADVLELALAKVKRERAKIEAYRTGTTVSYWKANNMDERAAAKGLTEEAV